MKFDAELLLANQKYFEAQMGSCDTSVDQLVASIRFGLPHGYSVFLTYKGLSVTGLKLTEQPKNTYYATCDEAFSIILDDLRAQQDALRALPCLAQRIEGV